MRLTLRATHFRVLQDLQWSPPPGVSVLAGPNGSGKTTALSALQFLTALFLFGHEAALGAQGGLNFRSLRAPKEEPVEFSLSVGDLTWILRFPVSAEGLRGAYGEELRSGDQVLLRAAMNADEWYFGAQSFPRDETRCCLRVQVDRGLAPEVEPLVAFLQNMRVYYSYWMNQVQRVEPATGRDKFLHHTGRNLWSVLANWKWAPLAYGDRYEWVLQEARKAFPDLLGTIEFDRGIPYIFSPDARDAAEGLLPDRMADGLLTGLLHLTAVAGASKGAVLAFDELENHLHPHAIRSILSAMRRRSEEMGLKVILTTHSPVVLNALREEPEQVFVLNHGQPTVANPGRMSDLHSEEWLAQSKLGSLYEQLAFAAPPGVGTR